MSDQNTVATQAPDTAENPRHGQDFGHPVAILWPRPENGAVITRQVTTYNAETGDLLPAVTRIRLDLGGHSGPAAGAVIAELTELCDEDGTPFRVPGYRPVMCPAYLAHREAIVAYVGERPMTEELAAEIDAREEAFDGPRFLTVVTRYAIAEMGIADPQPQPEPEDAVDTAHRGPGEP